MLVGGRMWLSVAVVGPEPPPIPLPLVRCRWAPHHHPVAGGSWFVVHSCGTREMVVRPSGRYEPSDVRAFRRFSRAKRRVRHVRHVSNRIALGACVFSAYPRGGVLTANSDEAVLRYQHIPLFHWLIFCFYTM